VLLRWTEADTFREGTILWSRRGEIAIDTHDPRDLNERGQVLLPALSSVWDRGVLVPIPETIVDGEPLGVVATGLGDGGHVIGTLWPVPGPGGGHPPHVGGFVWHDGTLTRLDIAPYGMGEPVDVDRRGRVLLNALDPAGRSAALLWEDGEYVDLGSLGGPSASSRVAVPAEHRLLVVVRRDARVAPRRDRQWNERPGPGHRPDTGTYIRPARRPVDTRPPLGGDPRDPPMRHWQRQDR
jgi:hypothetical protein